MPYISETVHPNIRASIVTLPGFMNTLGILLVWSLGYFLSWRTTAYFLAISPILLAIIMIPFPETPYWLVGQNRIEAGKKSLQFFRGKDFDITKEFNEIQEKHESKIKQNSEGSWKLAVKTIFSAAFLKPFSCVGVLYIGKMFDGFAQIQIFMIEILERSGSSIAPNIAPIVAGFTRLAFAGTHE